MSLRRYWPALLIALPLWAYIVYPVGAVLSESLTEPVEAFRARSMKWNPDAQPLGAGLRMVFHEAPLREAIWGTLKISVLSAITACALGLLQALLWFRRDFPGRRFFAVCGYSPMLLPPLVGTLAWYHLAGPTGWIWHWNGGQAWFNGFGQVLLLHTYSFALFPFSLVSAALQNHDGATEEAARNLGANSPRAFITAVWPAIRAPLAAGGLLAFMAAAASFSGPYILDNNSRYLTVEILNTNNVGVQRGLSVVLAVLALAALPGFLYFNRASANVSGVKGVARISFPPDTSMGRFVRLMLSIPMAFVLLAPPLMVVQGAFYSSVGNDPSLNTVSGFQALQSTDWNALIRSTGYAFAAAGLDLILAVLLALAMRRAGWWASLPGEFAVMLTLALPGSVVGVAMLSVFNAGSPLSLGVPLGGTGLILILAYSIRNLPFATRPVRAVMNESGREMEWAAAGLGASKFQVAWRITLPLILPTLIAAFLICFVSSAGEYVASALLFDSGTKPVSVRIYELARNYPGEANALALLLMGMTTMAIVLAAWLQRRWSVLR